MNHENMMKKYQITDKQIKDVNDILVKQLTAKVCDINVVLAFTDLLGNGDIK